MTDKLLKQIAKHTRIEIEQFHSQYNIGYEDLNCYCAIASHLLVLVAKKFEYKLELIEGSAFEDPSYGVNHCWTIFDNKIIDITATQFDIKNKVHIVSIKNKRYKEISRGRKALKNIKEHWCDQSPCHYKSDLNKRKNRIVKIIQSNA